MVDLIASTTTATGPRVHCTLDTRSYPACTSYSDNIAALHVQRHDFHGDWSYTLLPNDTM
jgi:hypothetical protein